LSSFDSQVLSTPSGDETPEGDTVIKELFLDISLKAGEFESVLVERWSFQLALNL
jgi:hypothetical protein